MSNIDSLNSSLYFSATANALAKKKDDEIKKKSGVSKKSFIDLLSSEKETSELSLMDLPDEIKGLTIEQARQVLIDSVFSAGDKLKKQPHSESFAEYRKSIGNFLKFVMSQTYELEKHTLPKWRGRARASKRTDYQIVQVVNQELDRLAFDILSMQVDQIHMAAKVEEITGLLVDLLS